MNNASDADSFGQPPSQLLQLELTILMPCLNESRTLPACIGKALGFLQRSGVVGEVLIADNGSNDGSQALARSLGARVVDVPEKGYGAALGAGIRAANSRFIIMGDSDDSYDFSRLDLFVERLREGAELVMGNRFAGGIAPGAMPALHRYLGNPVLSTIGRVLFRSPCKDFHCGLRGFDREAILRLRLSAPGMEFASEMVVKATVQKLTIAEVPTTLSPDGRDRQPHLRSWRDGWRHLRFLLLYSPRGLFLYPGLTMFLLGGLMMIRLLIGPIIIGGIGFDINTLLYAAVVIIIGWQSIVFWVCAKIHGLREGIVPPDPGFERVVACISLERALLFSLGLLSVGLLLVVVSLLGWGAAGFHRLDPSASMRMGIPAVTALLIGVQTAYGAIFMTFLKITR